MAKRINYKFNKRQRELKKAEKAQLKLQKRQTRVEPEGGETQVDGVAPADDADADEGPAPEDTDTE